MKLLVAPLAFGLLSLLIPDAVRAQTDFLIAPQLAIAGDGPITATFLGASQPFNQLAVVQDTDRGIGLEGFFFGNNTTPGARFELTVRDATGPVPAGTNLFFAASFPSGDGVAFSATHASPNAIASLSGPLPETPPVVAFALNAGVVRMSDSSVLIGFNPPGFAQPTSFGDFAVRIAVNNVCVK